MILKLTRFKEKEIDAINKIVVRDVPFEVDDKLGKQLLITGMYAEVKQPKTKGE